MMILPHFSAVILVFAALIPTVSYACDEDHAAHGAHAEHAKPMAGMDHTNMAAAPALFTVTPAPVRLPVIPGEEIPVTFTVSTPTKKTVTFDDLDLVHTQKLHVMAVDQSLNDYHHMHAVAGKTPGHFTVTFNPEKSGPYKFFVEGTTTADKTTRIGTFDLGGDFKPAPALAEADKAFNDGYRFTLLSAPKTLKVGEMAHLTVQVTDKDDKPVTTLEPIMGAFAHLVGFTPDATKMVHMHPGGEEPKDDKARGGPQMMFMLTPDKAGKTPLFAQVQIDGKVITAPFVVDVAE